MRRGRKLHLTPIQHAELMSMVKRGVKYRNIAAHFNIAIASVYYYRYRIANLADNLPELPSTLPNTTNMEVLSNENSVEVQVA